MTDLSEIYPSVRTPSALTLDLAENQSILLSTATLPVPPPRLSTRTLVIQRSVNEWLGLYRADMLIFQARKETLRQLGVLILAALFHRHQEETRVDLLHPASDIKHLVLRVSSGSVISSYQTRPESYTYRATRLHSSPWRSHHWPSFVLPCCYLTVREDDSCSRAEAWSTRDTVIGFGPSTGMCSSRSCCSMQARSGAKRPSLN